MASFILTPTNIDDLNFVLRNPITGEWTIPVLTFNPQIANPYYKEIDVLNDDPRYHDRVIDHFYIRLTEKWLFKKALFKKLLKYFKVTVKDNKGTVTLISDPDKVSESNVNEDNQKYVLKYIEKYFITHRFVEKTLREYVNVTHIKWYDLFNNSDTLVELFCHKLKKLIVSTIYESTKK